MQEIETIEGTEQFNVADIVTMTVETGEHPCLIIYVQHRSTPIKSKPFEDRDAAFTRINRFWTRKSEALGATEAWKHFLTKQ
jgi:hypothetical protein